MQPVRIRAQAFRPVTRGRLPDADAISPTVKAIVDGLVDAGILEDDGPRFVLGYDYDAPAVSADALWHTRVEVYVP
jgi:hypothetical protein